MENKTEYLSLYDFLGKPAGKELGGQVAQAAYNGGIKPQNREISNPKYTGTVHLYPKDFLDFYFREPETNHMGDELPFDFEPTLGDIQDDELPF
jgi:hypothetical protein